MKIAVVGVGVVGGAVADGLERLGHEIFRHDLKLGTTIDEVADFKPDLTFVCVPTNQAEDGSCDTSIVESVVDELCSRWHYRLSGGEIRGAICIKSTVTPGFTVRMNRRHLHSMIFFVPEFLRERSAYSDFVNDHRLLAIGLPPAEPGGALLLGSEQRAASIISAVTKIEEAHGRYPQSVTCIPCTDAELLKYYSNAFNAVRVTFANAFYKLAKEVGGDYDAIKDAYMKLGNATDLYLDCNENLRGFAGYCLPKDLSALAHMVEERGLDISLFDACLKDNETVKKTKIGDMRL